MSSRGHSTRNLGPAVAVALLALAVAAAATVAGAQMQPPTVFEAQGSSSITVDEAGNAVVREEFKLSAEAFTAFKQVYNPLSTFIRDLKPRSQPSQLANISIRVDEANNKVVLSYVELGAAVYRGDGSWALKVAAPGEKLTLSNHDERHVVLVRVAAAGDRYRLVETISITLPEGAKYTGYDAETGEVTYTLPLKGQSTPLAGLKIAGAATALAGAALAAYALTLSKRIPAVRDIERTR